MSREMDHSELTHLDAAGRLRMVDIGGKGVTRRRAVARAAVEMAPATLAAILAGGLPKGDVLAAARLAGIAAAKRTDELIPLCHQLPLEMVAVRFRPNGPTSLEIEAEVALTGRTGVEMEAMVAASLAGLTIYDMAKAADRGMRLREVRLVSKEGGGSGTWRREGEEEWTTWL